MSHQHHQRMSLRVANSNVSASVVDNTNTTNTATNRENNEENTNQMTCVVRVFFFLILRKSLEPLSSLVFRFALKNFFRESLIIYALRDDDDEVQHTHNNNEKVS
jgi:hypothetical protein